MAIIDLFAVGSVFIGFFFLIVSMIERKNPGFLDKIKTWVFPPKEDKPKEPEFPTEFSQPIYPERRVI